MNAWDADTVAKAQAADLKLSKPEERKSMTENFKRIFESTAKDNKHLT